MDKAFNRTYNQSNKTHHWQHHCTQTSRISFGCDTTYKDWDLNTKFVFNKTSMVEHKTNMDKNVATKKTYKRISSKPNDALQTLEEGITEINGGNERLDATIESDVDAWE